MLDLSDLITKKVDRKAIDVELDIKSFTYNSENYTVLEPLTLSGNLFMDNNIISLNAELKGTIELVCSRCLQKFPYPIDLKIDERFTDDLENRDDEVIFINNYEVDINEIVENNIILSLPIKVM